jgi:hypothetical protein
MQRPDRHAPWHLSDAISRRDGVIYLGGHQVHPGEGINSHPHILSSLLRARHSPHIGSVAAAGIVGQPFPRRRSFPAIKIPAIKIPAIKIPAIPQQVSSRDIAGSGQLARPADA